MIGGIKKEIQADIVIRTVKNCPSSYDVTERVLLIDADSIMYYAVHFPEDSLMIFDTEESQIEEAQFRVRNKIQEIQNNVEEHFNIKETFIFIGGKNNFRYKIFPDYKKNRRDVVKSPLLPYIKEYLVSEIEAIECHGAEADDYIIDAIKDSNNQCVVAAIDKDIFYHAPNVPIYDYRGHDDVLGEFKYISMEESRFARACQVLTGDSTDGIPGAVGVGKAYCLKNLTPKMTDYQFKKAIFIGYLKSTKGDIKSAKTLMKLNYTLLKLHTLDEIKNMEWR